MVRLLEKVQFKWCCWCGYLTWGVIFRLGQVNRLGVRGNYVCCPVIVVIVMRLDGAKAGGIKVIVWRGAERMSHKVKGGLFYGGVDPSGILSELPTYFSLFWSKKSYMIRISQYCFLLKPHKHLVAWDKLRFVSVFLFGSSFTIYFLSNCKWQLNENLLFLTLPW